MIEITYDKYEIEYQTYIYKRLKDAGYEVYMEVPCDEDINLENKRAELVELSPEEHKKVHSSKVAQ